MKSLLSRAASVAAAFAIILLTSAQSRAEPAAIKSLNGGWAGSGRIYYTDGSSESVRCTSYYTGRENELRMAIQCKSDSRPIHIRSTLRLAGGSVSGDWEERTFNASGSATGSVGANNMSLNLSGGGFTGSMSVSFGKSSHSVNVSTKGIGMSRASINFQKR